MDKGVIKMNEQKFCVNCKHCSLNIKLKKFEKANFFQKIILSLKGEAFFDIERESPHCLHPDVYCFKDGEFLVTGETGKQKMFCLTARGYSTKNYKTCGEDGKYFEKN